VDPTLSEVNLKTSLKMYLRNYFENGSDPIPVLFDKSVSDPYVSGMSSPTGVNRWLTILFDLKRIGDVSVQLVEFFCCTKQDADGSEIEKLVDKVNGLLFPENGHLTIPFIDVATERIIGYLFFLKNKHPETGIQTAADGSKFNIISVYFKWIAVV
jgi:hypothetical protein